MNKIARILRHYSKLKFRVLGHATIKDIPTDQFNELIQLLVFSGWKKIYVYDGYDAWIDYGKVKLKKGRSNLTFEWDNWTEGSIEGPREEIVRIAATYDFEVTNEWRWSTHDEKS